MNDLSDASSVETEILARLSEVLKHQDEARQQIASLSVQIALIASQVTSLSARLDVQQRKLEDMGARIYALENAR